MLLEKLPPALCSMYIGLLFCFLCTIKVVSGANGMDCQILYMSVLFIVKSVDGAPWSIGDLQELGSGVEEDLMELQHTKQNTQVKNT